jgi:hypothetical protein
MTEATTETPEETTQQDALFCEWVIEDNNSWNSKGITEFDIAVCFEYSHHCNWGKFPIQTNTFSAKRFQAALAAMRVTKVQKVGDHWYTADKAPDVKPPTTPSQRAKLTRKPPKKATKSNRSIITVRNLT